MCCGVLAGHIIAPSPLILGELRHSSCRLTIGSTASNFYIFKRLHLVVCLTFLTNQASCRTSFQLLAYMIDARSQNLCSSYWIAETQDANAGLRYDCNIVWYNLPYMSWHYEKLHYIHKCIYTYLAFHPCRKSSSQDCDNGQSPVEVEKRDYRDQCTS